VYGTFVDMHLKCGNVQYEAVLVTSAHSHNHIYLYRLLKTGCYHQDCSGT